MSIVSVVSKNNENRRIRTKNMEMVDNPNSAWKYHQHGKVLLKIESINEKLRCSKLIKITEMLLKFISDKILNTFIIIIEYLAKVEFRSELVIES